MDLRYCKRCIQMTNHRQGVAYKYCIRYYCLKCGKWNRKGQFLTGDGK